MSAPDIASADLACSEAWKRIKESMRTEIGEVEFGMWFKDVEPKKIEDAEFHLAAPTRFLKDHITGKFEIPLTKCIQFEFPNIKRINLKVDKSLAKELKAEDKKQAEAQAADEPWPAPDMGVMTDGRSKPPEFPISTLGEWWEKYILDLAAAASCPPDYIVGPLLSAAGMCIGNARWAAAHAGWSEPPVLWIAIIGKPSSKKTFGLKTVEEALLEIEIEMEIDHQPAQKRYQEALAEAVIVTEFWQAELKKSYEQGLEPPNRPDEATAPDEPPVPRIIVGDATPEKIVHLMSVHPKGMLCVRPELTGWLNSFGRYGTGGASPDRSMWLEAYDGGQSKNDRMKNAHSIRVKNMSIGLTGGIQPDPLATLLDGKEDGLSSRFLWCWPAPVKPTVPDKFPDKSLLVSAFRHLTKLKMDQGAGGKFAPFKIPLAPEAHNKFHTWVQKHWDEVQAASGPIANALGKMEGQVLRLSIVIEHLWWVAPFRKGKPVNFAKNNPPDCISLKAIDAALAIMEKYFKPMATRVYSDVGMPDCDKGAAQLARHISRTKPEILNLGDVRRIDRISGLKRSAEVQAAAFVLVEAGWLRHAPRRASDRPGGRQRSDYMVNPALLKPKNAACI